MSKLAFCKALCAGFLEYFPELSVHCKVVTSASRKSPAESAPTLDEISNELQVTSSLRYLVNLTFSSSASRTSDEALIA